MVTVKAAFTNKTKLTVNKFALNVKIVLIIVSPSSCRSITPLDATVLPALTTVALPMQLKLPPILTLSSMLVESVTVWRERDMTDPTSQFLVFRQTSSEYE